MSRFLETRLLELLSVDVSRSGCEERGVKILVWRVLYVVADPGIIFLEFLVAVRDELLLGRETERVDIDGRDG